MRLNESRRGFPAMSAPARHSASCMCSARRSAGCFGMSSTWCGARSARGHSVGHCLRQPDRRRPCAAMLRRPAPQLPLGLSRIPMARHIGLGDLAATRHVARAVAETAPDIVHGHGAKGAAYARLAVAAGGPLRVYTPHGGSLLFQPGTAVGRFYLTLEKLLNRRTDLFLFESAFIERLYRAKVGEPAAMWRIVPNGVGADEFADVPLRRGCDRHPLYRRIAHTEGRRRPARRHARACAPTGFRSPRPSSATARAARN